MDKDTKVHVIMYHHTHWDREWWTTFQQLRFRLVDTVDRLLDILDGDPTFTCFTLDGQTIVLKDYLEIRPENRDRLVRHIREGRIRVGPWHILPDEFLVSGEAHIRNLWLGERTARSLDVQNAKVGYLPDQFGHAAQMPQILAGFGIDSAVVWRGFGAPPLGMDEGFGYPGHPDPYAFPRAYNKEQYPDRMQSEFWWEAPDGTRVLGIYLPLEYYRGHYKEIPGDPEATHDQTVGRARRTVEYLRAYATTPYLLEPMGGDHLPVDARLPRILRTLNQALQEEGIEYTQGSLESYVQRIRETAPDLEVVWKGEGRAFGRRAHILPGVQSTRLYLKQMNRDCQCALERYAEPLQALRWLLGGRYEQTYLWRAWERLVENHPHDSICGCSVDQVHREMVTRFDEAKQMADLLWTTAQEDLGRSIYLPEGLPRKAQPIVVFNPLSWARTDAVCVPMNPVLGISPETWVLKDAEGREIPFQIAEGEAPIDKYEPFPWFEGGPERPRHRFATEVTEVRFCARQVPGLGYRTYYLTPRETRLPLHRVRSYTVAGVVAREKGDEETTGLSVGPGLLENEYLKVQADPHDGSLTVTDKESGFSYAGLNRFEDGGDAGDTYNYSWPLGDQILTTKGITPRLTWIEVGPAKATLRITWPWSLPEGLTEDRESRSSEYVPVELHSDVTLYPGVKRVDIRTHFVNSAKDHRLQAVFPLGSRVDHSSAESHFSVIDRPVGIPAGERGSAEPAVHEHPQMTFVSVADGERGLTIANRGLPEFSVSDDDRGAIRLSLLRSVGWLSREDTLARVGSAGPTSPTPEAQMIGPVSAEYSIIPHRGSWKDAKSYREAHDFNAPLTAVPTISQRAPLRAHPPEPRRDLAPDGSLVEVRGDVLVTAIKRAEDRDALIVRFVSYLDDVTEVTVRPVRTAARAYLVDLKEEPLDGGSLPLAGDGSVRVKAAPWRLVSVAFEYPGSGLGE